MKTKTLAIAGAISALCAAIPLDALAGSAVLEFKVPKSAYAFKSAPPCAGWRQDVHALMRDKKWVSTVSGINPIAGAVVATIGIYDGISASHGGAISELIRKLHGDSYSSCVSAMYAVPQGVRAGTIELSSRDGTNAPAKLPLKVGFYHLVTPAIDWSAWRDVEIVQAPNGQYFVAATATNWLHNGGTNQTLTITWSSKNSFLDKVAERYEIRGAAPAAPDLKKTKQLLAGNGTDAVQPQQ